MIEYKNLECMPAPNILTKRAVHKVFMLQGVDHNDSQARGWRWPIEVELMSRNPEGRGSIPPLGSRRSSLSLISTEHTELLRSTPSVVLCLASNHVALHVHCGLGQLSPLPTSGDDK